MKDIKTAGVGFLAVLTAALFYSAGVGMAKVGDWGILYVFFGIGLICFGCWLFVEVFND